VTTLSWVVGRGGLLGSHLEASLEATGAAEAWRPTAPVCWADPEQAAEDVLREAALLLSQAAVEGRPWRILWCAGAGVVATPAEAVAQETSLVRRVAAGLQHRLAEDSALAAAGALFFASSAGGVYAASPAEPPFDESSPVRALSPYGLEKLMQEEVVTELARAVGIDLLVGRLSNLYGPGQNLAKPQGLVSHVGMAALLRRPVSIYVPLDTIRDYLFAPDAGRMVAEVLAHRDGARAAGAGNEVSTKIFASEVTTTVAAVLGAWRQVLRRPLRVALAGSPVRDRQPRVLSFQSSVGPDVRRCPTPLTIGIEAVQRDQLAQLIAGGV
jgi:UDP-glucose 4-epimerase